MENEASITQATVIEMKPLVDRLDADHPLIYADQLSQLIIGPFVSRFTVAVENHAKHERVPVASIAMPTNMLHALALQIIRSLADQNGQIKMASMHEEFKKALVKSPAPK